MERAPRSAAPAAAAPPAPAAHATVAQSDGASHVDAAAPAPAPASAPAQDTGTVVEETAGPLSPLVRKMARENNIDLSRVKGTGVGGRITKQDLEAYLTGQTTGQAAAKLERRSRPFPRRGQFKRLLLSRLRFTFLRLRQSHRVSLLL